MAVVLVTYSQAASPTGHGSLPVKKRDIRVMQIVINTRTVHCFASLLFSDSNLPIGH